MCWVGKTLDLQSGSLHLSPDPVTLLAPIYVKVFCKQLSNKQILCHYLYGLGDAIKN